MSTLQSYQTDAILTASPSQLVLMMYEGALTAIDRALTAGGVGSGGVADLELDRAARIVAELRSVLDFEQGGEIAANLDNLYAFCLDLLLEAMDTEEHDGLDPVVDILTQLRDTWAESLC